MKCDSCTIPERVVQDGVKIAPPENYLINGVVVPLAEVTTIADGVVTRVWRAPDGATYTADADGYRPLLPDGSYYVGYDTVAVLNPMPVREDCNGNKAAQVYDECVVSALEDIADKVSKLKAGNGNGGANGLSAYELAKQQGFIGTLDEWLASLKGQRGAKGSPGVNGSAATIAVGSVMVGEVASVTNSGTEQAAMLNFVLPSVPVSDGLYGAIQEGYIPRSDFAAAPTNNAFVRVKFPEAFSKKPDLFFATLDIQDSAVRTQFINNVGADGFDVATNYAPSLQGVWYRAAVLK